MAQVKSKRISYADLDSRQQEKFNFQKLFAVLADYGFNCIWLSAGWSGEDF